MARWLLRVLAKPSVTGARFDAASINGEPGLLAFMGGQLAGAIALRVPDGDRIVGLRFQVNPDKLLGLRRASFSSPTPPVGDARM